jgi:hypothetical protein
MNKTMLSLATFAAGVLAAQAAAQKLTDDQLEFFEKKIRPVLAEHCYKCHSAGAEKIRGGLVVDTRDGVLKGGDTGPSIVPGNPDRSLLVKSIRYTDPDIGMPPKGEKLPDNVIADIEQWVKMGAPDPRDGKAPTLSVSMDEARKHWAYQPVGNPPAPKVAPVKDFSRSPIDAFVLAKLKEKGLTPSAPADKRTLLRRVTYDLTGLAPTPEEMDAFLADKSPNAFEKVVDRLLASPRYGERWGRHWLDVARYADTSGDRANGNRRNPLYPYAWTYRDYVIEAFNKDLPYDQFIVQQIAGDKLPEAAQDKEIYSALGFITVGKRFMGNDNEVIDDRIDVVTKGLMGLTAACARCHDHKFDPIPTKDYYSLHGVFVSSIEPREGPLLVKPEGNPAYDEYLKEVAKVEREIVEYQERESARFVAGMLHKSGDYLLGMHEATSDKERSNSYRQLVRQRGLDAELAEVWLEMLKPLAKKNDPVFGAWFRFAALPEKEFAAKAKDLAAEIAKGHQSEVHPLIAKAFAGKAPKSLKEVAAVYTTVLGNLHKELKLPEYVAFRNNRNSRFDAAKTETVLADINMESLRQYFFGEDSPVAPDARQMQRTLGVQFANQEGTIRSKIVTLNMTHPGSPARAMALEDAPRPRDSRVMIRGEARNLGPAAPRQFLEVLAGEKREPFKEGSGRLELARAIASKDNPLTARVFVNRVWYWHFGQPIVRTMSDFGLRSDAPTHPELLDHLASWFMDNGWSVKKLHKYILLSGTYQQDSRSTKKGMEADPTNQWLWRFNIQRLDFESIRDSLLQIGGKLDLTMGGPSVNVNIGERASGRRGDYVNTDAMRANPNRRTVYAMIDRSSLPAAFNIFDFANPDMSNGERILTTVPQQALFMMNGPFIVEQVKNLLARPEVAGKTNPEDKIRQLYRLTLQRAPTATELELAKNYLAQALEEENPQVPADLNNKLTPEAIKNLPPQERREAYQKMMASRQATANNAPRTQPLNAWERFTQVLLIGNEMVYLN